MTHRPSGQAGRSAHGSPRSARRSAIAARSAGSATSASASCRKIPDRSSSTVTFGRVSSISGWSLTISGTTSSTRGPGQTATIPWRHYDSGALDPWSQISRGLLERLDRGLERATGLVQVRGRLVFGLRGDQIRQYLSSPAERLHGSLTVVVHSAAKCGRGPGTSGRRVTVHPPVTASCCDRKVRREETQYVFYRRAYGEQDLADRVRRDRWRRNPHRIRS